jgi:ribonuclease P protein component
LWVVRAGAPTDEAAAPSVRVAYAIGKAVGGAVARNRLRRRLRALVDEADRDGALTPGLYLIGARPGSVDESFDGLRHHLRRALAGLR